MQPKTLLATWWAADILLFIVAYVLAYFLRVGWVNSTVFTLDKYLFVTIITAIIWLMMAIFLRCFGLSRVQTSLKSLFYLAASFAAAVMVHALMYYFLYQEIFSRLLLMYEFLFSAVFITIWHIVFQRWRHRLLYKQKTYPTLIVGVTRESKHLVKQLQQHQFPLHIVGIVDSSGVKDKEIEGVPVLGKLNIFKKTLDDYPRDTS
jgi:FlaA1/EpsC-like NDP-sugar epimerase